MEELFAFLSQEEPEISLLSDFLALLRHITRYQSDQDLKPTVRAISALFTQQKNPIKLFNLFDPFITISLGHPQAYKLIPPCMAMLVQWVRGERFYHFWIDFQPVNSVIYHLLPNSSAYSFFDNAINRHRCNNSLPAILIRLFNDEKLSDKWFPALRDILISNIMDYRSFVSFKKNTDFRGYMDKALQKYPAGQPFVLLQQMARFVKHASEYTTDAEWFALDLDLSNDLLYALIKPDLLPPQACYHLLHLFCFRKMDDLHFIEIFEKLVDKIRNDHYPLLRPAILKLPPSFGLYFVNAWIKKQTRTDEKLRITLQLIEQIKGHPAANDLAPLLDFLSEKSKLLTQQYKAKREANQPAKKESEQADIKVIEHKNKKFKKSKQKTKSAQAAQKLLSEPSPSEPLLFTCPNQKTSLKRLKPIANFMEPVADIMEPISLAHPLLSDLQCVISLHQAICLRMGYDAELICYGSFPPYLFDCQYAPDRQEKNFSGDIDLYMSLRVAELENIISSNLQYD
ncbi:MAG TPA: hypothetical protein VLH77_05745, partial [Gammaproteobacteria bacterium]|nr:hypothetical protein [Gammaproteobacteria bacterium]